MMINVYSNNVVLLKIAKTLAKLAGGCNCSYFQESAVSALERRDLLSYQEYGDDIPKTLLHMAIEEATGKDEFVSAFINGGAKADLTMQSLKLSHSMM